MNIKTVKRSKMEIDDEVNKLWKSKAEIDACQNTVLTESPMFTE